MTAPGRRAAPGDDGAAARNTSPLWVACWQRAARGERPYITPTSLQDYCSRLLLVGSGCRIVANVWMLKKKAYKPSSQHRRPRAEERVGPAHHEGEGECEVQDDIGRGDHAEETCPRDGQQEGIRGEALEESESVAHHIERAISIQQALLAFAADDGAEAQVAIARQLFG